MTKPSMLASASKVEIKCMGTKKISDSERLTPEFNGLERLMKALQKLDSIYDYSSQHQSLYVEAIEAYHAFIKVFLKDFLDDLNIRLGFDFYKLEALTLATAGDLFNYYYSPGYGKPRDSVEDMLVSFLCANFANPEMKRSTKTIPMTITITEDETEAETITKTVTITQSVRDVLEESIKNAQRSLEKLLPNASHRENIIRGLTKLNHLLSLKPAPTDLSQLAFERILVEYDFAYKPGENAVVNFFLQTIEKSVGITQEQIKREIMLKGTGQELKLVNDLKKVCRDHKTYLEPLTKTQDAPSAKIPLLRATKTLEKIAKIKQLQAILENKENSSADKIKLFGATLNDSKSILAQGADRAGLLFVKQADALLKPLYSQAVAVYASSAGKIARFFRSAPAQSKPTSPDKATSFDSTLNPEISANLVS